MIISGEDIVLETQGCRYFYEEDGDLCVIFEDGETYVLFSNLTKMRVKEMLDDIAIALGEGKPYLCLAR